MTSFHKVTTTSSAVPGSKLKNNLLCTSSGIPSLDHLIGGGIPTGTIFMVEEDVLGNYSRVMTKYFLAEGVACNHVLFVASADEDSEEIVKEIPIPTMQDENEIEILQKDKMKIAWRYEDLGPVQSSFGANTNFGHNFDLSKHISSETIKNRDITYWSYKNSAENSKGFHNCMYQKLLGKIQEMAKKEEYCNENGCPKNILRICISSIGSPIWMAMDCDNLTSQNSYAQDLMKFMYCLRVILKETSAVALVTVPSHLFEGEVIIRRLLYSVDNAVKLESFAGSSRETNPVFKDYHGLFHITKLSAINTLVPFLPPSLDLAFKLRRKKFVIEKLHLPPELQETSEREQDDITTVPKACGGFKKKDIDF